MAQSFDIQMEAFDSPYDTSVNSAHQDLVDEDELFVKSRVQRSNMSGLVIDDALSSVKSCSAFLQTRNETHNVSLQVELENKGNKVIFPAPILRWKTGKVHYN